MNETMIQSTRVMESPDVTGTIMFVDDEEPILAALRSLFRREGYAMHFFSKGAEALAFLQKNNVDIIVTDMRMPEITGVDLLTMTKPLNPSAYRIILSGYEDKGVVLNALAAGLANQYAMKPWNDRDLRGLVRQALETLDGLRHKHFEQVLGSLDSFPAPPGSYQRLLALISNADSSLSSIVSELEKDPPLVAKILHVANSVFYSSRTGISNLADAVAFIGTEYISGLVCAMEAFRNLSNPLAPKPTEIMSSLWSLSVQRSVIARDIARQWPGFKEPHLAHITSLLQDIGHAFWIWSSPEKYIKYVERCSRGRGDDYQLEKETFGATHDDIGSAVLEYWNLPREIVSAVALHHRSVAGSPLLQILQIADALCGGRHSSPHDPIIDSSVATWRKLVLST